MCLSPLHPLLHSLPKCEHHLHLEGALSPSLLFSLAARNSITLPTTSLPAFASFSALKARYANFSDLDDFLQHYYVGMSVLLKSEDFEQLAWEYFVRAGEDGVRHAEVFVDPQAHTSRGVDLSTVLEGIGRARRRAEQELGISTLLIACFLRHLPESDALETWEGLRPYVAKGEIVGVGLDSSEKGFPPEGFARVFEKAGEAGARKTAHAGEECGVESVRGALDSLGVERVDHGRACGGDEDMMRELRERVVLVTMCPLSNLMLKGVKSIGEMPVRKFLKHGVRFSVNSDDPSYFGGYVAENYCRVQEAFELSVEEWVWICGGSIEGSWCGEKRKEELRKMLGKAVENFKRREG